MNVGAEAMDYVCLAELRFQKMEFGHAARCVQVPGPKPGGRPRGVAASLFQVTLG